jgi:hypothetical protein
MTADDPDRPDDPGESDDASPARTVEDDSTARSVDDSDDEGAVTPEFDEAFPSITAGADGTASPSADAGDHPSGSPESETPSADPARTAEEESEGLGWQGWVLVGGLIVAMVLVPWAIVFLPEIRGALGSLGLGLRDAYLVLPMIPAVGLGALAIWAAIAHRRREE